MRDLVGLSLAMAAGFSFSYAVTLGRLFQWLVRRRRWDVFVEEYAPFRATGYAAVEEHLNSGHELDEHAARIDLRWNVPLHILLGLLHAATAVLVLRS